MSLLKDWIEQHCRPRVAALRQELQSYESEGVRTRERRYGGEWQDVTEETKQAIRDEIAVYEKLIAKFEAENA